MIQAASTGHIRVHALRVNEAQSWGPLWCFIIASVTQAFTLTAELHWKKSALLLRFAASCSPSGLSQSSQTDAFSPKCYAADKSALMAMIWSQRWPIDITLLGGNHRGEAAEFVAVCWNGTAEWFWNVNKSTGGPSDFFFSGLFHPFVFVSQ